VLTIGAGSHSVKGGRAAIAARDRGVNVRKARSSAQCEEGGRPERHGQESSSTLSKNAGMAPSGTTVTFDVDVLSAGTISAFVATTVAVFGDSVTLPLVDDVPQRIAPLESTQILDEERRRPQM
jgi:hypothetical protein